MTEEKNKKKIILYVVEDTKTAQFRYRVLNVQEALKKSDKLEVKWVLKTELEKVDFDKIELIVVLRQTGKDGKIPNFIRKAHAHGLKVLFDLDDLVFDYIDLPVLMRAIGAKNFAYWIGYVWGIRKIAKKVDGFVATNDFLGKMLTRSFDKKYIVIPNSLNSAQVGAADKLLNESMGDDFVVGYFSGSPTHGKDFRLVEPEILKFLETYKDAKFFMVGYMELSKEMQEMIKKKKVKVVNLVDYLELICLEASVSVNIAPLLINDFTNCKSELKFFEAAVVETTTIASPTYTFSEAISDGKNGFLAKPGEWFSKLEYLYNNPSENRKIAKNARKYVLENYYGEKFLKQVEDAYNSITT